MITPPITRFIGEAERTLQTLLLRQLQRAELTFAEWVALTILSGAGPVTVSKLTESIADAKVVASGSERDVVTGLVQRGLVGGEDKLNITEQGLEMFQPLRNKVREITASLILDLPDDDLATARRVLQTLTDRANQLLVSEPADRLQS
ncbi:MAG: hypothetical protein ACK4QP_02720 [Pseudorhizobium sp.]